MLSYGEDGSPFTVAAATDVVTAAVEAVISSTLLQSNIMPEHFYRVATASWHRWFQINSPALDCRLSVGYVQK